MYKKFLLFVLLAGTLLTSTACNTQEVGTLVPLVVSGAINALEIHAIATGTVVSTVLIAKLTTDGTDITKLYNDLTNNISTTQGTLAKIQVAISTLQNDLTQAFQLTQVTNPKTQVLITGIIQLVWSEVSTVDQIINAFHTNSQPTGMKSVVHAATLGIGGKTNKVLTTKQFKHQYNKLITNETGDVNVDSFLHDGAKL